MTPVLANQTDAGDGHEMTRKIPGVRQTFPSGSRYIEKGAFTMGRVVEANRYGREDGLAGQILARILATCIIARVLTPTMDAWFPPWSTSKMLDVLRLANQHGAVDGQ